MRIKNLPSIESMDGSQDALIIEQTDGSEDKSRKVSPAQIRQYVLNDMDDVPTADSNNPVKSGGTKTYVDNAVSQLNAEIGVISSGIQEITRKTITANDENAFLALAYADILADMGAWVAESPKCVTRIFTWIGYDHYIINAYRVQSRWIYSFCFTEGKAYYITYDCNNNSIVIKKSFTLT